MLQLENNTPFESQFMMNSDTTGADNLVLGVKATFSILPKVVLAEEQVPLKAVDEYLGEPGLSSLVYASEMLPPKPGSDIILNGHAYAPGGQATGMLDTQLSIGESSKTIRVFGDRLWINGGISEPQVFEKMPINYEHAFGGTHHFAPDKPLASDSALAIEANPIGKGFIGKRSNKNMIGQGLPNLEDPRYLIRVPSDQPRPMSYGYTLPGWQPRSRFAGTYDVKWTKTRAPFLPLDFDQAFYLNGSEGLSFERRKFLGGEAVRLINLASQADIQFTLPSYALKSYFKLDKKWYEAALAIETILIEPDLNRFSLIWKTQFNCDKKARRVSTIRVDLTADPVSVPNPAPTALGAL